MATTDSGIRYMGATSLGEALKTNTTLTELDLISVNKKEEDRKDIHDE